MLRFKVLIVLVLVCLLALPNSWLVAQEEVEWTCDDGPNDIVAAAQAAYDADEDETGWALMAHAQIVCLGNEDKMEVVQRTRAAHIYGFNPVRDALGEDSNKIDIGDHTLFMYCRGEGSPTVIFESGLGQSAMDWEPVLPAISTVTRACMYSRRGTLGSNTPPLSSDTVRTTQDQVDNLAALLETTEIEPPYVLVGHSIGGWNILLFVDQYPDLVEGIVLVDATHPDLPRRSVEEGEEPPPDEPISGEKFHIPMSAEEVVDIESFGDIPLAVITAGRGLDDFPLWRELQEDYVTYSTNSQHIIAENSGHMVMETEPLVIIESILWVLDEIEANAE